jgi:hypothetical protein
LFHSGQDGEGDAPAEPRGKLRPQPVFRLGRSLALAQSKLRRFNKAITLRSFALELEQLRIDLRSRDISQVQAFDRRSALLVHGAVQ